MLKLIRPAVMDCVAARDARCERRELLLEYGRVGLAEAASAAVVARSDRKHQTLRVARRGSILAEVAELERQALVDVVTTN
jgi:hypothetical protein